MYVPEIYSGLFVGNQDAADDSAWLEAAAIRLIVDCRAGSSKAKVASVNYTRLQLNDADDDDLMKELKPALTAIADAASKKGNILIHCAKGRNRYVTS